ncbi:MAG: hypothetical protein IPG84_12185 [Betaproteobacteria bacterium]|nr:hypothetical protein [Betaproteobacteria bacterium]
MIYVDWKLNKLCAEDGGVKVFITDKPPEYLKMPDGNVDLAMLQGAKPGQPYYLLRNVKQFEVLGSAVKRIETRLIRQSDATALGLSLAMFDRPRTSASRFFSRLCPVRRTQILASS